MATVRIATFNVEKLFARFKFKTNVSVEVIARNTSARYQSVVQTAPKASDHCPVSFAITS